ncbi:MAG: terminase small subunit [Chloracidobacterium sp.]|nr:terminase small subunit [Chloracidobacterium sp.]
MTPKQEAFARAYVETGNASEAYRRSYDAGNMKDNVVTQKAYELLNHGEVSVMVETLKAKAQKKHDITVEKLTEMALEAYKESKRISNTGQMQTASMVKAAEFLGKLHGLVIEKREITHKESVEDIPDAELANIASTGRNGTSTQTPRSSRAN